MNTQSRLWLRCGNCQDVFHIDMPLPASIDVVVRTIRFAKCACGTDYRGLFLASAPKADTQQNLAA